MVRDTTELAARVNQLWDMFSNKKLTSQEARTHIGFARTLLEAKKVEIAAAHLNAGNVPPVTLGASKVVAIEGRNGKKRAA